MEFHGYKETFIRNMVDGETLLDLTKENAQDLVKPFHLPKFLRAVENLRQERAERVLQIEAEDAVEKLKQRIADLTEQIESSRTCAICVDSEKNCRLGCGHVCCCSECAKELNNCPMCRKPVTHRETVYLS